MLLDSHLHVWDLSVRDQPWTAELPPLRRSFSLLDVSPALARHGIEGVVLVQTVCVPDETPEFLALAAAGPPVAGVVGWTDLTSPGVADRLAGLRALPGGEALAGIRHQVQDEADPRWLCRDDVRRGLTAVAEAGLAYDLVVRPPQWPAVAQTARALPGLTFVLDHLGKPDPTRPPTPEWSSLVAELGALPNVAAKLSGLTSEAGDGWSQATLAPPASALLEAFGPGRVMFGSDWPVCLLGGGYDATFEAMSVACGSLSADERAAVFGETARRVYRLGA
jgi:L-fuconolactonase